MKSHGEVDAIEWRFLISGQGPGTLQLENPCSDWLDKRSWTELCSLSTVEAYKDLAKSFLDGGHSAWKQYFDAADPQKEELPHGWNDKLSSLQKIAVLRCIRSDKVSDAMMDFTKLKMGQRFIEPPPFDLGLSFGSSNPTSPLIFVLSSGSDPMKALLTFAEERKMRKKFFAISLGQGQGVRAEKMLEEGVNNGNWVVLQNCHLCVSWMPTMETLIEELDPEKTHKDFRLWLTSMPSTAFPVSTLQVGVKMTNEPPKGMRANMKGTYYRLNDDKLNVTDKPDKFKRLFYGLAFFHALVIERKMFGPLGWNRPYDFNETDLDICTAQLERYVNMYSFVPYAVLRLLSSNINYGGRVTDDKDLRTIDMLILDYYCPEIITDGHKLSPSGVFKVPSYDVDSPHSSYMDYIDTLPISVIPEVFGMHDNALITCAKTETYDTFDTIMIMESNSGGGASGTRDSEIGAAAKEIQGKVSGCEQVDGLPSLNRVGRGESKRKNKNRTYKERAISPRLESTAPGQL